MNMRLWLWQRVMLAIGLTIGFYFLAIAVAAGLLWIPYEEYVQLHRVSPQIALYCIAGSLSIFAALMPRIDRFEPPGPTLDAKCDARLFALLHDVAARAGQAMPEHVYLISDVNAWVTHRGGFMTVGSRRVMGIGLPLLQTLTVSEFQAVVAHEFGHYASGDVALGPWVYKTRAAIGRTIHGVRHRLLRAPFLWYGRLFLRVTHGVSRQQEYLADRVAAQIAGAQPMMKALRRVAGVSPAFVQYLQFELRPVLQAGYLPPLAAGFDSFVRTDEVARRMLEVSEHEETAGTTDPYDTHPSIRDRISALTTLADTSPSTGDNELAISLIGDRDRRAHALTGFVIAHVDSLKPIEWAMVGEKVYAAAWRRHVDEHADWLSGLTAEAIPSGEAAFTALAATLSADLQGANPSEVAVSTARYLIGAAIGLKLIDQGWTVESAMGQRLTLHRGNSTFDPRAAVRALAAGETTSAQWMEQCLTLSLVGQPLATVASSPRAS